MDNPFLGQIQLFPYNFSPEDWAFCRGQLISISQAPDKRIVQFSYQVPVKPPKKD